ncbi:MAG: hypothetical protein EOP58_10855, partial [Sphingomonadales bacterium]
MKTLFAAALTATVALAGVSATPAAAQDRYGYSNYDDRGGYDRGYRDDRRGYDNYDRGYGDRDYRGGRQYRGQQRCGSGTTGTIIGGVLGALIGGEVGRGNGYYNRRSGTGTLVGAGAGALLG